MPLKYSSGYVQWPSLRSGLRIFSSKSDSLALKIWEQVVKETFPDKIFIQTCILDTYNAYSKKLPERFCPTCGNFSTKRHRKWWNFIYPRKKNIFPPTNFSIGRRKHMPIIPERSRSNSDIIKIQSKNQIKTTKELI